MMGFLDRLRSIFSPKKAEEKQDTSMTAIKDTPAESNEFAQASVQEAPKAVVQKPVEQKPMEYDPNTTGPHRDSKECPKCGAPNDQDIHKCWLCKNEI